MPLESMANACYTIDTGVINMCSDGNVVLGSPESNVAPGCTGRARISLASSIHPFFES